MSLSLTDPKLIVFAAAVIPIVALVAWPYVRTRRTTSADLWQELGQEYQTAGLRDESERKTEARLADREKRVEKLDLHDLDPADHSRFEKGREATQDRFAECPKEAVSEADDLLSLIMNTPAPDFDQLAAEVSADHPRVAKNYRSADEIALPVGKDEATPEDLRTALVHYRFLLEELAHLPTIVESTDLA
jgi:hypothetical protein